MKRLSPTGGLRAHGLRWTSGILPAAAMLLLAGCGDEDLRAYPAPKAEAYVEPPLFSAMSAKPLTAASITWDVPETWTEAPNASGILTAVFEAKSDAGDARITVTKLTNDGGGVLANVNRWRGQVGLPAVAKIEDQPMTAIKVGDSPAGLIDLAAPQGAEAGLGRMLVVMLPRAEENLTWYFKMTGPVEALDGHQPAFIHFVESVRFGEPTNE